jgi:mutator protein MutT
MTTVVAGIVERDGAILICRRRADQPHPLKWEFPGGKAEPGESPAEALRRELREELEIDSAPGAEIARYEFAYPGKSPILLIFIRVAAWSSAGGENGEIGAHIFDAIVWERPGTLRQYDFLEGDLPFLDSGILLSECES